MNETVSSDEEDHIIRNDIELETNNSSTLSDRNHLVDINQSNTTLLESLSTSSFVKVNNISRHRGHVIIPLSPSTASNVPNVIENDDDTTDISTTSYTSPALNADAFVPVHHKWSFTAAARRNRERHEWDGYTSSSEEDEEDINSLFHSKKEFHLPENLSQIDCAKDAKEFCNHSQGILEEEWTPHTFVDENHESNDIFCSPTSGV